MGRGQWQYEGSCMGLKFSRHLGLADDRDKEVRGCYKRGVGEGKEGELTGTMV